MWYMQVVFIPQLRVRSSFAHIYWLDFEILIVFALSNLIIAVKFLTERKRR